KRIVVAGCLVQRHRAKMLEWCPDIDALIGVFDRDRIVEAVRPRHRPRTNSLSRTPPRTGRSLQQLSSNVTSSAPSSNEVLPLPVYSSIAGNAVIARRERELTIQQAPGYFESDAARLRLTPRHYTYLRISEGCNQNCAFCTIPSIRGKMRSKPPEALHAEMQELLADGVFEFNLIGQDTTSYGHDIGYHGPGEGLAGMLRGLDALLRKQGGDATGWLRLMYAYPSCFTDEMIDAIAQLPTVVKYLDMPLQHISDPVLSKMRRHTSRKLIETLLEKLHRRIPGIAIRTTFIAGYPGETDAQHRELVDFIRHAPGSGFAAAGVFPYSPEPGTPAGTAHARGAAIPDAVVQDRLAELYETQQQVVFARHEAMAKAQPEFDVLVDSVTQGESKSKTTGKSGAGEKRVPTQGDCTPDAPTSRHRRLMA
ncbi:MAG: radical SAM protein, partial [Phycisphaerales bacterium]|nr:radical SAM protein [Phycisphaerales bacterium]